MQRQPILASSCARAATAAETRFRIDFPDPPLRSSRVIALDRQAWELVSGLAGRHWAGGRFLAFEATVRVNGSGGQAADATLSSADGAQTLLSDELEGADLVVMIATPRTSGEAASVIGSACATRMIMTAGLVAAGAGEQEGEVVPALRPHAMVLVSLNDDSDIPEILAALRV